MLWNATLKLCRRGEPGIFTLKLCRRGEPGIFTFRRNLGTMLHLSYLSLRGINPKNLGIALEGECSDLMNCKVGQRGRRLLSFCTCVVSTNAAANSAGCVGMSVVY